MADPKYLRFISVEPDTAIHALRTAEVHHIPALLERLFTPTPSKGIAKLNLYFSAPNASPVIEDVLGIATIKWPFDTVRFLKLSADEECRYYLQQLQDALTLAAGRYGWDRTRLDASCAQIRTDDFKARWWWPAKPKLNPTRQMNAQAFIEMAAVTRAWMVFRQRSGSETARVLFTDPGPGGNLGALEYVLGDLSWADEKTVRVRHANKRDYWLISSKGDVEFIYPRAKSDNAQALHQLGTLFWEGRYVLRDRQRALQLMRRAAALGNKHAERFVERNGQVGPGEN